MLPPELQSLIDQIDACERSAVQVVDGLNDEDVNWVPAASTGVSKWSIAQCLNHLTLMNEFYLRGWMDALTKAASRGVGTFTSLRPTPFGRWFARSMEPPVRMKLKANQVATPAARFPRAGLVEAYAASHDTYRRLVSAAATVDVNRIVRPNAFIPSVKMRLATVLLIIPAHDRRHLWQAGNVRRARQGV